MPIILRAILLMIAANFLFTFADLFLKLSTRSPSLGHGYHAAGVRGHAVLSGAHVAPKGPLLSPALSASGDGDAVHRRVGWYRRSGCGACLFRSGHGYRAAAIPAAGPDRHGYPVPEGIF